MDEEGGEGECAMPIYLYVLVQSEFPPNSPVPAWLRPVGRTPPPTPRKPVSVPGAITVTHYLSPFQSVSSLTYPGLRWQDELHSSLFWISFIYRII